MLSTTPKCLTENFLLQKYTNYLAKLKLLSIPHQFINDIRLLWLNFPDPPRYTFKIGITLVIFLGKDDKFSWKVVCFYVTVKLFKNTWIFTAYTNWFVNFNFPLVLDENFRLLSAVIQIFRCPTHLPQLFKNSYLLLSSTMKTDTRHSFGLL